MAAKYRVIQNPVIDSELRPSTPDLVLGGRTTGILGGRKTSQSLYYANFLTSNLPSYGSGKLDSFEFRLKSSGTAYGNDVAKPRLDLFLLDVAASVEGNLTSGSGDTTLDQDYLVYSWCTNRNHCNLEETMSNLEYESEYSRADATAVIKKEGPFMSHADIARYAVGWDPLEIVFYGVAKEDIGNTRNNPFSTTLGYKIAYDPGTKQYYCRDKHFEMGGAHANIHAHPLGRMYLSEDLTRDHELYPEANYIQYETQTLLKTDLTNINTISADPGTTTIFSAFETTRQFAFRDGTGADVPTESSEIEGFTAELLFDKDNAKTGAQALKLRTYAKEYANENITYNISDSKLLTNRQFTRIDALDLPAPVIHDGERASGNTDELPDIGATIRFKINIKSMAPIMRQEGLRHANAKVTLDSVTSISSGDGEFLSVRVDLDKSGMRFDTINRTLLSDEMQYLIGLTVMDNAGTPNKYTYVGPKDADEMILRREGHANDPTSTAVLTFVTNGVDALADYGLAESGRGHVLGARGLFFVMTDETIDTNTSHAGALRDIGRRENTSSNPSSYSLPGSMFEWGIMYDPLLESSVHGPFRVVQHGKLCVPGEKLFDDEDAGTSQQETNTLGDDQFFVDYNGSKYFYTETGNGYSSVIAGGTGGGTISNGVNTQALNGGGSGGNVAAKFDEYFEMICMFSPDDEDMKLFFVDENGENLLTSAKFIQVRQVNNTVVTYEEPAASTSKWPSNLYIYLNNHKDLRSSSSANTSLEDDYWLTYDAANAKTLTETEVLIDNIKFENFWPNTFNSTLSSNNTEFKGPIMMNRGFIPSHSAPNKDFKGSLDEFTFSYVALGHHTSASVSGGNQYVPIFFDGFSAPRSGLDASVSLSSNTIAAMSASTVEPQGYQCTAASFDSSKNGYAAGSFVVSGGDFDNENFKHKGAGILRWDDAEAGAYPSAKGALAKRECILASAKVLEIVNATTIIVDDPNKLRVDFGKDTDINQTFVIYKYGKALHNDNKNSGLTIHKIQGNKIIFNENITNNDTGASTFTSDTDTFNIYVSPEAHWVILKVNNTEDRSFNAAYRIPVHGSNNDADFTAGVTFNEFLYSDGPNENSWDLLVKKNSNVITDTDFGFGVLGKAEAPEELGYAASKWAQTGVNTFTMESNFLRKEDLGATVPIMVMHRTPTDVTTTVFTNNHATNENKPLCVTVFKDELPKVNNFQIKPNEDDPFEVDFTWECGDDDSWYGLILLSTNNIDNQYTGSIIHLPLNEVGDHDADAGTITDNVGGITVSAGGGTAARKPHYTIAGLAGNALNFDGSDDHLELGGSGDDCLSTVEDEFSAVAHITHDDAAVGANGEFIIKKEGFDMFIDQNEQVNVIFRSDSDSGVTLKSTSKIAAGIPMSIIATLDSQLTNGNCKLFINGKLEALSGPVLASHANNDTQTGWVLGTDLHSANGKMFIGNESAGGSKAFDGNIEELVFYNTIIYPVDLRKGEFTLDKPLKELTVATDASPKAYSTKLFAKDYHNIRGKTSNEVACSAQQSFRKSGFRLNNS